VLAATHKLTERQVAASARAGTYDQKHDPEKWEPVFPATKRKKRLREIMLKQKYYADRISFSVAVSRRLRFADQRSGFQFGAIFTAGTRKTRMPTSRPPNTGILAGWPACAPG
jgi:hypothetical protein